MINWAFLKKIQPLTKEMQAGTLGIPPLDQNALLEGLKKLWQWTDLELTVSTFRFYRKEELSPNDNFLAVQLSPLDSFCFWATEQGSLDLILEWMTDSSESWKEIREAFYHTFVLKTLNLLCQLPPLKALQPSCTPVETLPQETMAGYEVTLTHQGKGLTGKILLPLAFQTSCQQRYHQEPSLSQDLHLTASFCVELLTVTLNSLKKLEPGDLLLLEPTSWNPKTETAKGQFFIEGHAVFEAQLNKRQIKLLKTSKEM